MNKETVSLQNIVLEYRVIELDDVTVTATRTERRRVGVSQQINLIGKERIRERNAKTSAEVLREEVGIFVQKTSHGGGSAIIRGLSSNQILILIDGIRLNCSFESRYASADGERSARTEISLHNTRFGFQGGLSYKDYGDLRRGKNSHHPQLEHSIHGAYQSPTGFTAHDVDSKLIFRLSPSQMMTLAYHLSRKNDVPRYDKYENDQYLRWVYHPQNRHLAYLTYENTMLRRYLSSMRLTVSYQEQEEGRDMQKQAESPLTKEHDDVQTIGCSLQLSTFLNHHGLTYGIDVYLDDVTSERFFLYPSSTKVVQDVRGRYPDGSTYNSLGIFLQDDIQMSSKWAAIAGARYSSGNMNCSLPGDTAMDVMVEEIEQHFSSLTGSLGLVHKLNNRVFLTVNVGQAFRAPNLSDISKLGESKGSTFEVQNLNLRPEKIISFDCGFNVDSDRMKARGSIYYNCITDLIASADATYNGSSEIERGGITYKVKSKQNVGRVFIRGLEASIDCNVYRRFFVRANMAMTYGHNTTQDEPVGGIPPTFGLAGLEWREKRSYFHVYSRFATRQDRLSADDMDDPRIPVGGTPGWYILNVRAGYDIYPRCKLRCAVENLFDLNYREHGSGVNGPGRNFIVSVKLQHET